MADAPASLKLTVTMTSWQTDQHLRDHFDEHGREMGYRTPVDYDASAQTTLDTGRYFSYFDSGAGLERTGCFDRATGGFVVLTDDGDLIVSHFRCTERYIRRLAYNNYDG